MREEYHFYNAWALAAVGFAAGLCNGMIGCGGGIFIVYALSFLYKNDPTVESKDVFATAVASILPLSLVSTVIYMISGSADGVSGVYRYLIPAVIGGAVGAFFLDKIKSKALKRLFAVLVMWAGLSMVLRRAGVM